MSTSFSTPPRISSEWDSDVDDSNSSEEFMYVKGTPPPVPSPDLYKQKLKEQQIKENSIDEEDEQEVEEVKESRLTSAILEEDIDSVWITHEDKVPVSSKGDFFFNNIISDLTTLYTYFIKLN